MSNYSFSIHFPTVTCFGGGAGAAPRLLTCLPMTLQGTRRGVVAFRSAPASQKPAQNGAERSRGIQPLPPEPEPRSQRLRHHVGPTAPVLDVPDRQQGKANGGGTCRRHRKRQAAGERSRSPRGPSVRSPGGARKIPRSGRWSVGGHPGPSRDRRPAEHAVVHLG